MVVQIGSSELQICINKYGIVECISGHFD